MLAPGARVVDGQVTVPAVGSDTLTSLTWVRPGLVTVMVQVTTSPTLRPPSPLVSTKAPVFTNDSAASTVTGVTTFDGAEVTGAGQVVAAAARAAVERSAKGIGPVQVGAEVTVAVLVTPHGPGVGWR